MTELPINKIICGDALEMLKTLPDKSVNCCVTSPPYYGLKDYGVAGQLGLEKTPEEYIDKLVAVFREVKRVLKDDGTLWVVIGDSYSGSNQGAGAAQPTGKQATNKGTNYMNSKKHVSLIKKVNNCKPKDLIGIPWMAAFALRSDGWYLRQDIIWHKPNPMPESVPDRCTKAHEYIFLLSKSAKYYYDAEKIREVAAYDGRKDTVMKGSNKYKGGFVPSQSYQSFHARGHERWQVNESGDRVRNKRSVWTVPTQPFSGAHFATFPPKLIEPMILAGCPKGGIVLDPFIGSGTTGKVARELNRNYIGIDLNPKYCEEIAAERIKNVQPYLEIMT